MRRNVMSGFAIALGIGIRLGIERERRKGQGTGREGAGVRTFALVALLGAASARVCDRAGLAMLLGHRRYAFAIWPGLAVVLAAAWLGWSLEPIL